MFRRGHRWRAWRAGGDGEVVLTGGLVPGLWRHETGDSEMLASAHAVERFNGKQNRWHVIVGTLPQGSYQQAVVAAAMTKKLPCMLDLDQPSIPSFA